MNLNKSLLSNLTKTLLQHNDIVEFKNRVSDRCSINDSNLISKLSSSLRFNQSVKLSMQLEPKSIFFSNNDYYIGIIGRKDVIIIDSRTGKQVHSQILPDSHLHSHSHTHHHHKKQPTSRHLWLDNSILAAKKIIANNRASSREMLNEGGDPEDQIDSKMIRKSSQASIQ
jgi:ABC-type Zn2+ transport system substrate-binding protein/surface adhesin